MPSATSASAPRQPRSSEPHGNRTVTRSARVRSSSRGDSAAPSRNRAFSRPPFRAGLAARRDASAIDAALASMPMTRVVGSAAAVASTVRPSPVPISIVTRSWRATIWATYPTSTSTRRRPTTDRIMPRTILRPYRFGQIPSGERQGEANVRAYRDAENESVSDRHRRAPRGAGAPVAIDRSGVRPGDGNHPRNDLPLGRHRDSPCGDESPSAVSSAVLTTGRASSGTGLACGCRPRPRLARGPRRRPERYARPASS